jgi:hypothetical protein
MGKSGEDSGNTDTYKDQMPFSKPPFSLLL